MMNYLNAGGKYNKAVDNATIYEDAGSIMLNA
jgi:hypothetical protein